MLSSITSTVAAPGGKGQAQVRINADGTYSIRRTVAAPTTSAASGAATQSTGAKPTQQKASSSERTVSISDFVNHTTQLLDWASKELENARHLVEQREAAGKNRWDSTRELKELGLDAVQVALDAGGLIPGLGAYPDGVNTVISLLRENYGDAAWSAVSCIPWVGWFNGLGKTGIKGKEALELIAKAAKNDLVGKSADEVINAVGEAIEAGRKALEAAGERIGTWADEAGEALGAKLDELDEALGMSSSPQPALATAGGTGGAGGSIRRNDIPDVDTSTGRVSDMPEEKAADVISTARYVIHYNKVGELSAEEVNEWFVKNIDPGYQPPYTPGTRVDEIILTEDSTFVRVYADRKYSRSSWVMRAEDIEGLTAKEIREKFALPTTPKYVSDVTLEKGTRLRMGEANRQDAWGAGGGIQFDLYGKRLGEYTNERLLEGK